MFGEFNVITLGDDFDPDNEEATGREFVAKMAKSQRGAPHTPERFEIELEKRKQRAEQKKVNLFTSGSDQPFVIDKYRAAFIDQTLLTKYMFDNMGWSTTEIECLAEVLAQCKVVEELRLV